MNVRKSCLAAVLGMSVMGGTAWAQATSPAKPGDAKPAVAPAKPAAPTQPPAADPATEQLMAAAKPGEHHKHLAQLAGEWDGVVRMLSSGETVSEAKVSCSSKMEFDGRYLYAHHSGDFGGRPFRGVGVMGYNNVIKQYESSWIDNMGTGVEHGSGQCSTDGKVFTLNSEMTDPEVGKKVATREVTTVVDPDHYKMEFFQAGPDGKEVKTMEIEYARKATAAAPGKLSKPSVKIQSTAPTETKKPATAPEKK